MWTVEKMIEGEIGHENEFFVVMEDGVIFAQSNSVDAEYICKRLNAVAQLEAIAEALYNELAVSNPTDDEDVNTALSDYEAYKSSLQSLTGERNK
jgi:hypothetical protein